MYYLFSDIPAHKSNLIDILKGREGGREEWRDREWEEGGREGGKERRNREKNSVSM